MPILKELIRAVTYTVILALGMAIGFVVGSGISDGNGWGVLIGPFVGIFMSFAIIKRLNKTFEMEKVEKSKSQPKHSPNPANKSVIRSNADKTIIMLMGQEAVGKTTLLSLMYKEFSRNSRFQQFVADDDSGIALEEAYQKLCAIIEQPNFTRHHAFWPVLPVW